MPLASLYAAPTPPQRLEWVSTAQLTVDTVALAAKLPPDVTAVVGVPRSGMLPASQIATALHLPLYELTEEGQLERLGHGSRGRNFGFRGSDGGRLAVIDDTVYGGGAMLKVRAAVEKLGRAAVFCAVYVRPEAAGAVDVFGRLLPSPHILEWNWANNGPFAGRAANAVYGDGIGCDLDGILSHDESSGGRPGAPYMLSCTQACRAIIIGRPESARAGTEAWLRKWGVKWRRLHMLPNGVHLRTDTAARHKAGHFGRSRLGMFIESDPAQAALIHRWTSKPVICPRASLVFCDGLPRVQHLRHTPRCDYPTQDHPGQRELNGTGGLFDLLAHVGPVRRMAEIGCNRGVSTEVFALAVPEVVAVDSYQGERWAGAEPEFAAVAARYPGIRHSCACPDYSGSFPIVPSFWGDSGGIWLCGAGSGGV